MVCGHRANVSNELVFSRERRARLLNLLQGEVGSRTGDSYGRADCPRDRALVLGEHRPLSNGVDTTCQQQFVRTRPPDAGRRQFFIFQARELADMSHLGLDGCTVQPVT